MFYCDPCGTKNKWPTDIWLPQSFGACEVCGQRGPCFDTPTHLLKVEAAPMHEPERDLSPASLDYLSDRSEDPSPPEYPLKMPERFGVTKPVSYSVMMTKDVGDFRQGMTFRVLNYIDHGGNTDAAGQYELLDNVSVKGAFTTTLVTTDQAERLPEDRVSVYLVTKNTDFTEGRGPQMVEAAFGSLLAAKGFLKKQSGIMGCAIDWNREFEALDRDPHRWSGANGWGLKIMLIADDAWDYIRIKREEARQAALKKLSPYERELLDLPDA